MNSKLKALVVIPIRFLFYLSLVLAKSFDCELKTTPLSMLDCFINSSFGAITRRATTRCGSFKHSSAAYLFDYESASAFSLGH